MITSLIYINRFITATGQFLHPVTWRPLLLSALIISQKVHRKRSLSVGLGRSKLDEWGLRVHLSVLHCGRSQQAGSILHEGDRVITQPSHRYNVNIKAALYAQYYFELRDLYKDEGEGPFPLPPLSPSEEKDLESRSEHFNGPSEYSQSQKLADISALSQSL